MILLRLDQVEAVTLDNLLTVHLSQLPADADAKYIEMLKLISQMIREQIK